MVVVSDIRHAWRREPRAARHRRALLRYLGFMGMAGLALAALVLLASVLRDPFGHPRVLFLFASGADLSGNVDGFFDQPGIAFPADEQARVDSAPADLFGGAGTAPFRRPGSP